MRTVETERLVLQPVEETDLLPLERIAAIAQDSARQWRINGFGPWSAIDKASGEWIGRVGLDELDDWPDAWAATTR